MENLTQLSVHLHSKLYTFETHCRPVRMENVCVLPPKGDDICCLQCSGIGERRSDVGGVR